MKYRLPSGVVPRALALLAAFLAPPMALAEIRYVDANLASGAGDGTSWADAFQGSAGLQAALAVAVAGDRIFVADGVYRASESGVRTASFALKNGVEIFGSFLGGETSPDERPPFGTAPSVLEGDLGGNDASGIFTDNSFHVVTTVGTNATAVLDGFVVARGAANGASAQSNDRGGGILCLGAVSPTIRNCRFVGNRSTFGGAAGYVNNGGAPTFTDCSFEDGVGGSFGGAFDIANGGAVRFDRCRFTDNTAARAGALEIFASTGVVVTNSLFVGNVATGAGGGGAIWIGSGGNPRVVNCTIVANRSTAQATGGVRVQNTPAATVVNSILWQNEGPGGAQGSANQVDLTASVQYSIVQGGFAGTGNLASDPSFADQSLGDYSLAAGSPAIDAGLTTAVPPSAPLDLAGGPRFRNVFSVPDTGPGPAPVVDIGAFEAANPPFAEVAGCASNPAHLEALSPAPVLGASFSVRIVSSSFAAGFGAFYLGAPAVDANGCGLFLPGLGELMLGLVPGPLLVHVGFGVAMVPLDVAVPAAPSLAGLVFGLQGVWLPNVPGAPLELSNLLVGALQP